jgi:hypothetical protein
LYYITQGLNIAATVVTLLVFTRNKEDDASKLGKFKMNKIALVIMMVLFFAAYAFIMDQESDLEKIELQSEINILKEQNKRTLIDEKMKVIAKEAKTISAVIDSSIYDEVGMGISNLIKIVGFYKNFEDVYPEEYKNYNIELQNWQEYQAKKIRGEAVGSFDKYDLIELVEGADAQLESIYNNYKE